MDGADEATLYSRHLLVCSEVRYDPFAPGAAHSLRGLIVYLQPLDDIGFPLVAESLVLFAQLFGDAGRYTLSVDLVFVDEGDDTERTVATFGPTVVIVRPGQFVDSISMPLWNVPFPQPGVYEFRLRRDAVAEPLASERLLLKG